MFDLVLSYLCSEKPHLTVVTGPPRRQHVPSHVPTVIDDSNASYTPVEEESRALALRRVAAIQRNLAERHAAREDLTRRLAQALTDEERANPVSLPTGNPQRMPAGRSFDSLTSLQP